MNEHRDELQRDPDLSAQLREHLSAPPLRPGFAEELEFRLETSDAARAQAAPTLHEHRKRRGRRLLAAVAVVAAAAVALVVLLPAPRGTPMATAADIMLASMNAAAGGSARVVRLSVREGVMKAGASPSADAADRYATATHVTPEQLVISTSGDVRWTVTGKHKTSRGKIVTRDYWTQDEQRHETMSLGVVTPDDGSSVLAIERPSWGTDVYETWPYANIQALASSLRAHLAEAGPNTLVTQTTYLGRPAWHAVLTEGTPGAVGLRWSVIVDKATGLLMASDYGPGAQPGTQTGTSLSFWVTRIEVDPQLPKGWMRLSQAGRERIGIYDRGTRFGTPESVAKHAWPTPVLIPQRVPAGYCLSDVATTYFGGMTTSPKTQSRLIYLSYHHPHKYHSVMTSVDASVQRVVARFRRGFSSFVVDTRPPSNGGGVMPGFGDSLQNGVDVKLTSGYLKGQVASTSISPNSGQGPTLVTHSGRFTIRIYGDLTRQELIEVANSLRRY